MTRDNYRRKLRSDVEACLIDAINATIAERVSRNEQQIASMLTQHRGTIANQARDVLLARLRMIRR